MYYEEFEYTRHTFEDRTPPGTIPTAIGRIVVHFSMLEEAISDAIAMILEVDEETGKILTSEVSFQQKMHMLASLVEHVTPQTQFNSGDIDQLKLFDDLSTLCFKCAELRNRVVHSNWDGPFYYGQTVLRRKSTAKASKGLNEQVEVLDDEMLLDIADYIIYARDQVWEYFRIAPWDAA